MKSSTICSANNRIHYCFVLNFYEGEISLKGLAIMSQNEENGNIEEIYEEKEIIWKITGFSSIADSKVIESPTFSLSDFSWYFRMVPKHTDKPGFGVLALFSKPVSTNSLEIGTKSFECQLKFDFRFKKCDNSVVKLTEEIITKAICGFGTCDVFYFKLPEEQKHVFEGASLDVLILWCTLKCNKCPSDQPSLRKTLKPKKLIKLDTLSMNFKDLIANKESCDTTMHVQDKEYKAHRAVLIARSPVFAAMFLHDTSEKQTGFVTIPDCDPGEFLEFLYCGKFEKPSSRNALYLYETSDKYEVEELKAFCVEYLMENLCVENVCDVVILADKYTETNLLSAAQEFLHKNLDEILDTSEWDSLVKNNYGLSKKLLKGMSSKVKVVD